MPSKQLLYFAILVALAFSFVMAGCGSSGA